MPFRHAPFRVASLFYGKENASPLFLDNSHINHQSPGSALSFLVQGVEHLYSLGRDRVCFLWRLWSFLISLALASVFRHRFEGRETLQKEVQQWSTALFIEEF